MADTTTLTIRIDEQLKAELERAASAADQSVTEYVVRSVKARMTPQCPSCGRAETASAAAMSSAYVAFVTAQKKKPLNIVVTTLEGSVRGVYSGHLAANRHHAPHDEEGMLFLVVGDGGPPDLDRLVLVPIPRATVTGWAEDDGDWTYFRSLLNLGYLNGNAWALRGLAMSQGLAMHRGR